MAARAPNGPKKIPPMPTPVLHAWQRSRVLDASGHTPRVRLQCMHCKREKEMGGGDGQTRIDVETLMREFITQHGPGTCGKVDCPKACGCAKAKAKAKAKKVAAKAAQVEWCS